MNSSRQIDKGSQFQLLKYIKNDLIFFDLETTGLSPIKNHIIEIGAVKLKQNGDQETFESFVFSPIDIPKQSQDIHGISDHDLKDAPKIEDVLKKFFDFIRGCDLVAHNAMFDLGFIINEAKRAHFDLPIVNVYDSLKLTRSLLAKNELKPDNFKLSTLGEFIKFPFNSHRAFDDALATVHIWNYAVAHTSLEKDVEEAYKKSLIFTTKKVKSYNSDTEKFDLISELSSNQQNAVMVYNGGSRRGKERPIKPIALLPLPKNVSLYAHCLIDHSYKVFTVSKIQYIRPFTELENLEYQQSQGAQNGA